MAAGGDTQPNQGDQDGRMAVLRQDSGLEKKAPGDLYFFFFFFLEGGVVNPLWHRSGSTGPGKYVLQYSGQNSHIR